MNHNIKSHITRAIQIVLVFGVASLILLYALGYYDLTFIDRDSIFGGSVEINRENDTADSAPQPAEPESDVPTASPTITSTTLVFSSDELNSTPATPADLPDGYYLTAGGFIYDPGVSTLVRLTPELPLPSSFSHRTRTVSVPDVMTPEGDGEKYVIYTNETEAVPAVEVYMGYLLIDHGDGYTYICSRDGALLSKIPYEKYTPAYTRDSSGRALFKRTDDDGNTVYFHLSDDGASFVQSDYNDRRDSRGLYFDYPDTYGVTDDPSSPSVTYNVGADTFNYKNQWGGNLSYSSFTAAYPYTNGLAAVTSYYNRGGLYFIGENGQRAFATYMTYVNRHSRYVISNYLPPLTSGIESIGFYYFDHGLTRVRRQIIDNWNWTAGGVVSIVSEEDILIRADGSEYELPAGYTLEGYSNGALLLSKDGRYGFLSCNEWIAQPIYADAIPFVGGIGVLVTEDGRYGAIDSRGDIVLPFAYSHISQVSDGVIAAYLADEDGGVWELFRIATAEDTDGVIVETID